MAKRRTFTVAFKARVAKEALRGDRTAQQIAAKHGVHPNQASQWKRKASEGLVELFERGVKIGQDEREAEIRRLHQKVGPLVIERDFFARRVGALSRTTRKSLVQRDPFDRLGLSSEDPPSDTLSGVRRERARQRRPSRAGGLQAEPAGMR